MGEKLVIFVHSKLVGRDLAGMIAKKGIPVAFHNASVSYKKRQMIEETFNDQFSGLDIVVATSTLAAGVNIG